MWHRKAAVAGSFYPGSKEELTSMIDRYLEEAGSVEQDGELIGLISPHAGYVYSGPIAAYAFNRLKKITPDVVVVFALSHRARFDGASILPHGIYETPLAGSEIDSDIGNQLVNKPCFTCLKEVHEMEHSLEVQVPFIQRVVPGAKLVPIIVGTTDLDTCRAIADEVSAVLAKDKRKYAIVISTDLSHYHSYQDAGEMDNAFIESLKTCDENEVKKSVSTGKSEACGEAPVLTGLMTCKNLGAGRVEILKYANSGDTAGSKDQVVGYVAAAILK
ncbi:MAG: AmmeMemoRadiSam system protein B [bacterium]|nr:AmmeMemoRadiSam system protein B [bacterium]